MCQFAEQKIHFTDCETMNESYQGSFVAWSDELFMFGWHTKNKSRNRTYQDLLLYF